MISAIFSPGAVDQPYAGSSPVVNLAMRMGRAYGRASDHGTAAAAGPSQRRAATVPAITAYPVSLAWMSPSWHIQVQAQIVATLVGTGPPRAGT